MPVATAGWSVQRGSSRVPEVGHSEDNIDIFDDNFDNFDDDDHKVQRDSSQVPELGHCNDTCCCGDDDDDEDYHGGGDDGDGDAYLIGNGKVFKGKMRRRHCCFDSLRIL